MPAEQETEALYGTHEFQDLCQGDPTAHEVKQRVRGRITDEWEIPSVEVSATRGVGKKWKLGGKQTDLKGKLRETLAESQDLRRTVAAQLLRLSKLDPVAQYAILLQKRTALVNSRRSYVLHTLEERLAAGQVYDERSAVGRWNKYTKDDALPGEKERMEKLHFTPAVMTELYHREGTLPGTVPCTLVLANKAAHAWTAVSKDTLRLGNLPPHWEDLIIITDRYKADVQQAIATKGRNPDKAFDPPAY